MRDQLSPLTDLLTSYRLLASAFFLLLVGYSGIRHFYDSPDLHGPNDDSERISHIAFVVLILCSFLTGAGGNAGLSSAVNATAKSFPDELVRPNVIS